VGLDSASAFLTTPLPPPASFAVPERANKPGPHGDGEARFLPGVLLNERYRIIGLLGRGGMGEVYRADDIKLAQPVALKFLPESLARDAEAREQFVAEVRTGRQVSHPNVCRLYDLVEINGHLCLSMEYVDGEDLATLLSRIGRLPVDKAVAVARDITAGLAAAHDKGVIHRDLKPANIMIDGRGRARITDFGLAALVDDAARAGIAGTPAYMAPEQFDGVPASVRSDLYALGLILYEAFSGKRLFEAQSIEQFKALHATMEPPRLSSSVHDVPPAVEQVVRQCLARNPSARPPSALAVMAALPGGDPLQAALAAGETPTPAMVAAAGKVGDLAASVAWTLLLASMAGLILIAALSARTTLIGRLKPELSPEMLSAKAEQILGLFGYRTPPADRAGLYWFDRAFLKAHASGADASNWQGIEAARPGPLLFVYRGGEQPLIAMQYAQMIFSPSEVGLVRPDDPPLSVAGMTRVMMDRHGRLTEFVGVPPVADDSEAPTYDWSIALGAAGLDVSQLRPAKARWAAPVDSDFKQAWDGAYADQPDVTFHVEAASWHGKPVWFAVMGPWYQPPRSPTFADVPGWIVWATLVIACAMTLAFVTMARRNLRLGRGDGRGAGRIAMIMFAGLSGALLLRADHTASIADEVALLMNIFVQSVFFAVDVWVIYVAFEPYARRRWPQLIISWSRLLDGRLRDPLVARDLLLGMLGGIVMVLVVHLSIVLPTGLGHQQSAPLAQFTTTLTANRHLGFFFLQPAYEGFAVGFGALASMFLFLRILRFPLLAHVVTFVCIGLAIGGATQPVSPELMLLNVAIWYFLLIRVGILAASTSVYVYAVLPAIPLTLDVHAWYVERTFIAFALFGALLVYAFHASLAGKSAFGTFLLDRDEAAALR
jgi:serine/threonine-protein kinase